MSSFALPRFTATNLRQTQALAAVSKNSTLSPKFLGGLTEDRFEKSTPKASLLRFGTYEWGDEKEIVQISRGLAGVKADYTAISNVMPSGDSLVYRGYDIRDLMQGSFEETAHLLIKGTLPTETELAKFDSELKGFREAFPETIDILKTTAKYANLNASPMDMLRLAVTALGLQMNANSLMKNDSPELEQNKALNLTAIMPTLVAANYRISQNLEPLEPKPELSHAENFLYMLKGKVPDPEVAKIFDKTLTAYADHGFNASTTAVRVTASTQSDMFAAIASGIGTLKGPLHGGANEKVMHMFLDIDASGTTVESYIKELLNQKKAIPGFGHKEYDTKNGDPRARVLLEMADEVAKRTGNGKWNDMAKEAMRVMDEFSTAKNEAYREAGKPEKYLPPNVDFPIAYIFHMLDIPLEVYTPIFAMARTAGWTAHVVELHGDNVLYRPKAEYTGPEQLDYTPLAERGKEPSLIDKISSLKVSSLF